MKATSCILSKRKQPMKQENEDKAVLTETDGGSKIQVTFPQVRVQVTMKRLNE